MRKFILKSFPPWNVGNLFSSVRPHVSGFHFDQTLSEIANSYRYSFSSLMRNKAYFKPIYDFCSEKNEDVPYTPSSFLGCEFSSIGHFKLFDPILDIMIDHDNIRPFMLNQIFLNTYTIEAGNSFDYCGILHYNPSALNDDDANNISHTIISSYKLSSFSLSFRKFLSKINPAIKNS